MSTTARTIFMPLTIFTAPDSSKESDDQLLSKAKSADQQAFAELCLRYRGMLMNSINRIVRHPEDTEDVLQDTFLKTYQHLPSFRGACSFSTWLVAIGTNASLMLLRKRKALRKNTCDVVAEDGETLVVECRDTAPDPELRYMMCQTGQKVNRAVKKLSPQLRNSLEIYYKSELRLKDVAKIVGISEASTKSRILRARRILRRSLKQNECWTPGTRRTTAVPRCRLPYSSFNIRRDSSVLT
jgi:RNA polymerase sigma-70 factor (ECF subfamily)